MVRAFDLKDKDDLFKLFKAYYAELDCEDDTDELVRDYVLPDWEAELLKVAVAEEGGDIVGFVIYQVDGIENEWCFLEGHGDVREIYVTPDHRRQGVGKQLVAFAEADLGDLPLYLLPEESAEAFFLACGYQDFGGYCCDLDSKVFEKQV